MPDPAPPALATDNFFDTLHVGPGVQVTLNPQTSDGDSLTETHVLALGDNPNLANLWNAAQQQAGIFRLIPSLQTVRLVGMERGRAMCVKRYSRSSGAATFRPNFRWRTGVRSFLNPFVENSGFDGSATLRPGGVKLQQTNSLVTFEYFVPEKNSIGAGLFGAVPFGWTGLVGTINAYDYAFADIIFPTGMARFDGYFGDETVWAGVNIRVNNCFRFTIDTLGWSQPGQIVDNNNNLVWTWLNPTKGFAGWPGLPG